LAGAIGVRLNRFLAQSGLCSRRSAERLIIEGRVYVNGRKCTDLSVRVDPEQDTVVVNGDKLSPPDELLYIALHKPAGYVTTMSDERGRRCVKDLIGDIGERLFPVGRLDKASEGLLLFTNDGLTAHRLMHPSFGLEKVYRVTLDRPVTDGEFLRLRAGVELDDGLARVVRARAVTSDRRRVELVIREGRKREIRRLFEELGLGVLSLRRTRFGPVKLGRLAVGKWRRLSKGEVSSLLQAVQKTSSSPQHP
jgi:23S rRNA pseudouridine2605 synthase